jgi:hypothetical protein
MSNLAHLESDRKESDDRIESDRKESSRISNLQIGNLIENLLFKFPMNQCHTMSHMLFVVKSRILCITIMSQMSFLSCVSHPVLQIAVQVI